MRSWRRSRRRAESSAWRERHDLAWKDQVRIDNLASVRVIDVGEEQAFAVSAPRDVPERIAGLHHQELVAGEILGHLDAPELQLRPRPHLVIPTDRIRAQSVVA